MNPDRADTMPGVVSQAVSGDESRSAQTNTRRASDPVDPERVGSGQGRPLAGNVVWHLIRTTVKSWLDDYAPSMGAALAYYSMVSLAPLLLIVIALVGSVFGQDAAEGEIFRQLESLMGSAGAEVVQSMVVSVTQRREESSIGALVGIGLLLIGATSVFSELQNALDRIWRAPSREHVAGWWRLVRSRLLSFGMILSIGFLLMVSLIASAALAALGTWWAPSFDRWGAMLRPVNEAVGFAVATLLFAMIYKILPRVRVQWRDVWVGAAVTALFFTLGKYLIGLYFGRSSMTSVFGAAGSLAVLLVWLFYSAQVFLLGAEFTRVYAHRLGSRRERPLE